MMELFCILALKNVYTSEKFWEDVYDYLQTLDSAVSELEICFRLIAVLKHLFPLLRDIARALYRSHSL